MDLEDPGNDPDWPGDVQKNPAGDVTSEDLEDLTNDPDWPEEMHKGAPVSLPSVDPGLPNAVDPIPSADEILAKAAPGRSAAMIPRFGLFKALNILANKDQMRPF